MTDYHIVTVRLLCICHCCWLLCSRCLTNIYLPLFFDDHIFDWYIASFSTIIHVMFDIVWPIPQWSYICHYFWRSYIWLLYSQSFRPAHDVVGMLSTIIYLQSFIYNDFLFVYPVWCVNEWCWCACCWSDYRHLYCYLSVSIYVVRVICVFWSTEKVHCHKPAQRSLYHAQTRQTEIQAEVRKQTVFSQFHKPAGVEMAETYY